MRDDRGGGGWSGGEFGRRIEARLVSAAYELGRPAIAVIVSLRPDLDALSDQDAPDAHSRRAVYIAFLMASAATPRRSSQRSRRPFAVSLEAPERGRAVTLDGCFYTL